MITDSLDVPLPRLFPLGDQAVVVEFGHTINETTHTSVCSFAAYLETYSLNGLIEYVPAFTTVTIYYDPWLLSDESKKDAYEEVCRLIHQVYPVIIPPLKHTARIVEIPVCYGGEYGPDLSLVANHTGLTQEEVVNIHVSNDYLVYMIGFAPGFPYLGGMNPRIAAPRKAIPRTTIPAGAVGIAGRQTGIYPINTPGGWQLIGRTPLLLFDPSRQHPSLLKAGDMVRFIPITEEKYLQARKEADIGY